MKKISDLYKKLWQSLIQPERIHYTPNELKPPYFYSKNGENFKRFDYKVDNMIGQTLAVSVYLPVTKNVSKNQPNWVKFEN